MDHSKFLFVVVFLFATNTIAFCLQPQISSLVSWKIIASELSDGKLAFTATRTRTITYKVKVQRFLLPRGDWQAVDLDVRLIRIFTSTQAASFWLTEKITSSYCGEKNVIMKTFTAQLKTRQGEVL